MGNHHAVFEVRVGRMVLVDESEVELLLEQVGTRHLNLDLVAEAIPAVFSLANEAIVFLVELIVVVLEVAHRHESLALVFIELNI